MKNIKCPTVARLASALNTDEETALKIRAYVKEGYRATPRQHPSHDAVEFMEGLNKITEFHGVESLFPKRPGIEYLNAGDSYTATLAFNYRTGNLFITDLATLSGSN